MDFDFIRMLLVQFLWLKIGENTEMGNQLNLFVQNIILNVRNSSHATTSISTPMA